MILNVKKCNKDRTQFENENNEQIKVKLMLNKKSNLNKSSINQNEIPNENSNIIKDLIKYKSNFKST